MPQTADACAYSWQKDAGSFEDIYGHLTSLQRHPYDYQYHYCHTHFVLNYLFDSPDYGDEYAYIDGL